MILNMFFRIMGNGGILPFINYVARVDVLTKINLRILVYYKKKKTKFTKREEFKKFKMSKNSYYKKLY